MYCNKTVMYRFPYILWSSNWTKIWTLTLHWHLQQFHCSSMVLAYVHLKKLIFDCFYTSRKCTLPILDFLIHDPPSIIEDIFLSATHNSRLPDTQTSLQPVALQLRHTRTYSVVSYLTSIVRGNITWKNLICVST